MRSEQAAALVTTVGCSLLFIQAVQMLSTVVDDAYISARYAEHLAVGDGLVYNAGEAVEGFTNLSWTLFLAVASALAVDLHLAMVAGGLSCGIGTLVALTLLTGSFLPRDRRGLAGLPALLLGCDPHFASVVTNGLETALMVLLVVALPWTLRHASPLACLVGPLLVSTRPEGAVVVFCFLVAEVLPRRRTGGARALWLPAGFSGVALLVLEVWRVVTYGSLVPNTFEAKASSSMASLLEGNLRYLHSSGIFWELVAGAALLAVVRLRRDPRAWGLALVASGLALLALQVPLWMPGGRLLMPSLALTLVLAVAALGSWWAPSSWRSTAGVVAVALGVGVSLNLAVGPSVRARDAAHSVEPGSGSAQAARHLRAHLQPGAVVAIRDAGAFAYALGPAVRVAELHDRALTVPHPNGRDTAPGDVLGSPPDVVVTTLNRENRASLYYLQERALRAWIAERGSSYRYLGRVRHHVRRFYDVYVRADVAMPELPSEIVVNRLGPAF